MRKGFQIVEKKEWTDPKKHGLKQPKHAIYCGKCGRQVPQEDAEDWLTHEELSDPPLLFTDPQDVPLDEVVREFKRIYKTQVICVEESDSERPAQRVEVESLGLVTNVARHEVSRRLNGMGIYRHQKDAIDALVAGQNVMLATATSSGKSLCFQTAILDDAVRAHAEGRPLPASLYLGPLNALIDDQFRSLAKYGASQKVPKLVADFLHESQLDDGTPLVVAQYHGGVVGTDPIRSIREKQTRDIRRYIRQHQPQVVFTNPEMLTLAMLPYALADQPLGIGEEKRSGGDWRYFFERLRLIVLDECHIFRGVFGAHMANLMRRIRRLCAVCGNEGPIRFALCSATLRTPGEFGRRLIGALPGDRMDLVIDHNQDTSERHRKQIIFLEKRDPKQPMRMFAKGVVQVALGNLRLHTIAFQESIPAVQDIYFKLRNWLKESHLPEDMLRVFCSTFLPDEKRDMLEQLRDQRTKGVVSTSALGLGIDIGVLSTSVLITYPGTLSKAWQMLGRAGRRGPAMQLFLVGESFLDQYWAEHPREFLDRQKNLEEMIINPDNPTVLEDHLLKANYDCPLDVERDRRFFDSFDALRGPGRNRSPFDEALDRLQQDDKGGLQRKRSKGREVFVFRDPKGRKVFEINLRSTGKFKVPVYANGKYDRPLLEETDVRAIRTLYPGALFIHNGRFYGVERLRYGRPGQDSEDGFYADVRSTTSSGMITVPKVRTDVKPDDPEETTDLGHLQRSWGQVSVTTRVDEYYQVPYDQDSSSDDSDPASGGADRVGAVRQCKVFRDEHTPSEHEFTTQALWIRIPEEATAGLDGEDLDRALFTAGKAIVKAIPLHQYAAPEDLTFTIEHPEPPSDEDDDEAESRPTLYIYENCVGGVGLAHRTYTILEDLISEALHLVIEGCPRCGKDAKSRGCPACVADVSDRHDRTLGGKILKQWLDGIGRTKKPKKAPQGKTGDHGLAAFGFDDAELIDSGGFGSVYKAMKQGRVCAVKVAKLGRSGMKLLAREGLLLKRLATEPGLACEHLVEVYDVIEHGDSVLVAMEYADGGSLTDRVGPSGYRPGGANDRHRQARVVAEFLPIVDGVRHLHRHGIVHRDLKPQNILYVNDAPKVADLGIARRCKESTSGGGTPGYEAPGQLEHEHEPREADDVYSLALVLHEMFAGSDRLPDWSGEERKLHRVIPAELRPILTKALAFDRGSRYQDADEFGVALRAFLAKVR
jgi:DEAD/DEAH box helicase domain-containing protein